MPFFICPNCKQRSVDHDRREELDDIPVACHSCGFGFLFELMDDYYPAPNSGFVVCDQDARILAAGRGVFELTGYQEGELLGGDVVDRLGLSGFEADRNPAKLALEWGVRRLGEQIRSLAQPRLVGALLRAPALVTRNAESGREQPDDDDQRRGQDAPAPTRRWSRR